MYPAIRPSLFFRSGPFVIIAKILLAVAIVLAWRSGALACTDILNAFLSAEKLNETVKNELVSINSRFQRLDVALNQNDRRASLVEIGALIDLYYDFYVKYYQNPPAQFIDDPNWGKKLSEVNLRIRVILEFTNAGKLSDAHTNVRAAYDAFSAIYRDRVPMQEQNVIDMISARISSMEVELKRYSASGGTCEVSIEANNLRALCERLVAFDGSGESYLRARRDFADAMAASADRIVKTPVSDSASVELTMAGVASLRGSVETFLKLRRSHLDRDWFDGKK